MSDPYKDCKDVSDACPISESIYGYAPNLGANAFYAVIFALCALVQVYYSWKFWKLWKTFSILAAIGCLGESLGYIGRLFLHSNPWNGAALPIQLVLLMVSPSFLAAAIYTILRKLVKHFGQQHTFLPERFWTWPFVTTDLIGFVLQCGGGILSAAGENNPSLASAGNTIMIFGVSFQAVIMLVAGCLSFDFALRVRRRQGKHMGAALLPKGLKIFLWAHVAVFFLILTRCIYRIPELAGGVGGALMRKEADFMIFDGLMIVLAVILQTAFHPGNYADVLESSPPTKYELRVDTRNESDETEYSLRGRESFQYEAGREAGRNYR